MVHHLAQEHTRDFMAADHTMLVKSIFQVYGTGPLDIVLPLIDGLLKDIRDLDRHKQRAAAGLIGGLFRGSKHWPQQWQARIWTWFEPYLPVILDAITPDTQVAWEMLVRTVKR